jgi:nicotinamide-nucleotide amidase
MLEALLSRYPLTRAAPRHLGVVGMTESDAQVRVERAISGISGVGFTILARPGDVRVILTDLGAGSSGLERAAVVAQGALGDCCYASDGSSLAETVVRAATERGLTVGLAESCTGGMVAAALTDVPGASRVLLGSVVSYSDEAKTALLGVPPELLQRHGAVSAECVEAMAVGVRAALDTPDVAVAVSGVAGPGGGSAAKPVGTVWFGVLSADHHLPNDAVSEAVPRSNQFRRDLGSAGRDLVRARATAIALDCLRRSVLGLPIPG